METLSVGRLVLLLFFVAFVLFPKHPCGSRDDGGGGGDGGSMKKTKMMKCDHHEGEEKINLDLCVEHKCKDGPCWCCVIPGLGDCYGNQADCESHCPPYHPPQSSPSN